MGLDGGEYAIGRVAEVLRGLVMITELAGLGGVSARTGEVAPGTSQLPSVMSGGETHGVRWPSGPGLLQKGQFDL